MKYYKAEKTMTVGGKTFTLTDIKASERDYSHAVISAGIFQDEYYLNSTERNPSFEKIVTLLTFHQGLSNAEKALKSHKTIGGSATLDKRNNIKREINPTTLSFIVETELVDSRTYREFKKGFISTDFQVKARG